MAREGVLAYLGFGSNLEPEENIRAALGRLVDDTAVELLGISTIHRTSPLPVPGAPPSSVAEDPDFLNGVVEIRTTLSAPALMELLGEIEDTLLRVRSENRYAPRTMDLDLLLYDPPGADAYPQSGNAPLHPDVLKRPFVAVPLLELAPGLLLPPDGQPLEEVAADFHQPWGRPDDTFTRRLRREMRVT